LTHPLATGRNNSAYRRVLGNFTQRKKKKKKIKEPKIPKKESKKELQKVF
jgi:hypothetical protein